jgi:hypothetical protein
VREETTHAADDERAVAGTANTDATKMCFYKRRTLPVYFDEEYSSCVLACFLGSSVGPSCLIQAVSVLKLR